RKHLKVVAAAEGTVMAADKEGNLAVVAAAPAEAEEGKYLADIVLVRNSKNTASIHEIDADAELLDEDESFAISTPAPATLFGVTVAEGNATDAEGNTYAIDPTFAAIPEGDAEAWKLTGYVLADDNDKPVIYLTASQAIDRVALPVINPAEAAFLDKTTVSITCATEGAAIEYSLDGGKTWNPYTGAFDATASGEILARATADDMLPSHEAKASVVREYLSGDVTITVDEQEALTVITITGPAGAAIYYSLDGTAEKLYNGPLTLTNDTQAVINGQIKAYALESGKRPGAESVKDYQIKFKPEVTGIDGVGADQEAGSVRVEGNSIIVPEGAQTFDIAGRRVNPQGLPRGIYIVRLASGKAVKAVVK
uniref:chitobiase/beta-hexosaminidase C-terminal domain-containing protein n=3 Tax=Paramuribaculum intestinale TaxID=2094151 RepID=UPI0025B32D9E